MKRNVCEEKGGKVPEAKVGSCIRSKEKGLLDKYDGLATHTHTLSSPRSRKGCLRKRGTRSRRCVHNNTQRHNNTDAESHSPTLIHRTEIRRSHAGCRGCIGRQEHPETQSNTRTYGTKKSSYVHAYIGRDGKWRKRVQT